MTATPSMLFPDSPYLTSPPTPPQEVDLAQPSPASLILPTALRVFSTEARALIALEDYYATSASAQAAFTQSVQLLTSTIQCGGKLIVCGVGKSGKIGEKIVATMNSLAIVSVYLHPTEAMHGDLGVVCGNDLILLITFSGSTAELHTVVPHLPQTCPRIILTSHTTAATCSLTSTPALAHNTLILPAPIPEPEIVSFGIPAPTTSTTVALAIGDALAVATAQYLHEGLEGRESKSVFARNHPGGALGKAFAQKML